MSAAGVPEEVKEDRPDLQIELCDQCHNIMTPVRKDGNLMAHCNNCDFEKPWTKIIVETYKYRHRHTGGSISKSILVDDPTLPHTIHQTCPNDECLSRRNRHIQEAVAYSNPANLRLTYICVVCRTSWACNT